MTLLAPSSERRDARQLGPLDVRVESTDTAIEAILSAIADRRRMCVAFANTHLLYHALKEESLADGLRSFYLLNDGVGMALLSRLACGAGFIENLNGTDFTPRLLAAAPAGTRVFLLGAREHVVEAAAAHLGKVCPHLVVCGRRDGYSATTDAEGSMNAVAESNPDIVLVAMGNPLQEQWIGRCRERTPSAVFVAVGALFDFLAGEKPRAPRFFQIVKLEWLFRLTLEPGRLWRRYTVEIGYVTLRLLQQRLRAPPRVAARA